MPQEPPSRMLDQGDGGARTRGFNVKWGFSNVCISIKRKYKILQKIYYRHIYKYTHNYYITIYTKTNVVQIFSPFLIHPFWLPGSKKNQCCPQATFPTAVQAENNWERSAGNSLGTHSQFFLYHKSHPESLILSKISHISIQVKTEIIEIIK